MRKLFAIVMSLIGVYVMSNGITYAQSVHPSVQAKIDSLQAWIKAEMDSTGTIDQTQLEIWNNKIRKEQERVLSEEASAGHSSESKGCRNIQFSGYSGSSFSVPKGKKWKIKKLTCSAGMGEYNVLVTSIKFDPEYNEGAVIYTPSYTAESSLINDDASNVVYIYEVIEFDMY